jgi:hypothetical protein
MLVVMAFLLADDRLSRREAFGFKRREAADKNRREGRRGSKPLARTKCNIITFSADPPAGDPMTAASHHHDPGHEHGGHEHHDHGLRHGRDVPRRDPVATPGSLLRSSALARLGGAALAVAAIWAGVFWAIA